MPFEGYGASQIPPPQSSGELHVDFESVFGTKAASSNSLDTDGKAFYSKSNKTTFKLFESIQKFLN